MTEDAAAAGSLRRAVLAEAMGVFSLVFVGTGAIMVDAQTGELGHLGVALAFGLIVMVVIYAVGEVSGAHINPAVTLGFWAAGRLPGRHVGPFVAGQLAGALAASATLWVLLPGVSTLGETVPAGTVGQSLVMEGVLTFLLMFVILSVAVGAREVGLFAGIAVGATVAVGALVGGPVSGASLNPARSLGPALVSLELGAQWIYLVAPCLGALAAVPVYRAIYERAPSRQSPDATLSRMKPAPRSARRG